MSGGGCSQPFLRIGCGEVGVGVATATTSQDTKHEELTDEFTMSVISLSGGADQLGTSTLDEQAGPRAVQPTLDAHVQDCLYTGRCPRLFGHLGFAARFAVLVARRGPHQVRELIVNVAVRASLRDRGARRRVHGRAGTVRRVSPPGELRWL